MNKLENILVEDDVTNFPTNLSDYPKENALPEKYSELELLKEENSRLLEELYKMEYKVETLLEQLRQKAHEEDDWK